MNRRKKTVSAEEESLFRSALKDAEPLKKLRKMVVQPRRPKEIFVPLPRFRSEPLYNERIAPAIGGHADSHLRRGRLEPEARLDLHGMSQRGAYHALLEFLVAAQADGKRLVLVITGKGGVLRAQLPLWLGQSELQPLVAGANEAHVRHGGGGAFYVVIKKHTRDRRPA
jgi:DNA-nicking Smr family endonuclease